MHRHTAAERNPEQYVERKCESSNRTDTTNDLEVKNKQYAVGQWQISSFEGSSVRIKEKHNDDTMVAIFSLLMC